MLAANLCRRHSSFLFLNHPDYSGFCKTALAHSFAPSKVEQTLHQSEGGFGGQVSDIQLMWRDRAPVRTDMGLPATVKHTFTHRPRKGHVLFVFAGLAASLALMEDDETLDFQHGIAGTWTISCSLARGRCGRARASRRQCGLVRRPPGDKCKGKAFGSDLQFAPVLRCRARPVDACGVWCQGCARNAPLLLSGGRLDCVCSALLKGWATPATVPPHRQQGRSCRLQRE